jgi:predicted O-methyltransferase YrrM
MGGNMYSVVVPTMWKFKPFMNFLTTLLNYKLVGEVILIDNDIVKTPEDFMWISQNPKLKVVYSGINIGVNPAWNIGVEKAKFPYICLLNDDMIFDLTVLDKLPKFLNDYNTGVIGICPGVKEFNQPLFIDGEINITPWQNEHTYGFGCLMFINKKNYIPIPEDLVIYYGDNFIFDTCLANKKTNYIISNILHYTPYATTVTGIGQDYLEAETIKYEKQIEVFRWALNIFNIEYNKAISMESDIKDLLPILYDYAYKCESVLELGVRTGLSTRAFLNANLRKLTSIDLEEEYFVRDLFNVANQITGNYNYIIHDSRTYSDGYNYDLLFIDTDHMFEQLTTELNHYHKYINKYIIIHDVFIYGTITENPNSIGLLPAVFNFIIANPEWKIKYYTTMSNGLIILERN